VVGHEGRGIIRGLELFSYFRSSASFRVRIALALKRLPYDYRSVHLVRNEQSADAYAALSANQLVPLLVDGDAVLTQSLAIIEYLDETHPDPPLLPPDPAGRARVRAIAQDIACEIHPLNNLRVLRYLVRDLGQSEDAKNTWYRHWVETGLEVVERQLAARPSTYCHGDLPTLADCVLVPQIFNAQRLECRLDHVPNVMRVHEACMALPAFAQSQPSACPDAA
jgi:maleylacetoacetate isomerase